MKRKIFTSLAAAGLLACTIATASASTPAEQPRWFCFYQNCSDSALQQPDAGVPSAMSALEQRACELVNQHRTANGLEPLTMDAALSVKARVKSQDMKDNGYFSHNSPTYGTPFSLMRSLGIAYGSAGENIAMGYTTAEAVVSAWMQSQAHRENILSSKYHSMGVGYVDGYWTQWFIG